MENFLILCILGVFYPYFGYPLILMLLKKLGVSSGNHSAQTTTSQTDSPEKKTSPSVSIIITVRNEKNVIRAKLENTLELTYFGKPLAEGVVQLIVASDSSDDGTDEIVEEYRSRGVELVRLPERGGKEKAQAAALREARGEIVIFTDAKIKLEAGAIDHFVAYFQDPRVGTVSSIDKVEVGPDGQSGEGFYVRYEMWLRALESDFGSLVGLSGSCFAARRLLCENLRTDLPSDFGLLIEGIRRGYRGVHAPDVVAVYQAVATEKAEFERKVRTVLRGITAFFSSVEVLDPRRFGAFSWQIISHKLGRWLVPFFFVLGILTTFKLSETSNFYSFLSLGVIVFFGAAWLAANEVKFREVPWCKIPLFFLVVNWGIAVAWWKYLTGVRSVAWNPSEKGK